MNEEELKEEIKEEIINQILFKKDGKVYTIEGFNGPSFLRIKEQESKIYDIMESLYKNIEFYKKFIEQGNQYSFSSDCHGDLYALLSALLSSGVVDLDKFEKNIKNIKDAIIFIDRTNTTDKLEKISYEDYYNKISEKINKTNQDINLEDLAELAKYIPIPNIPLKKEGMGKYKYINMGDNIDRGSLSNVCHIFAQYLSSEGLFFIDGNHEKFYKINDVDNIALNGGQLPPCTKPDKNKILQIQDKFVKEYTGNKNFGNFCHYIKNHISGKNFLISHTFVSPNILKKLLCVTYEIGLINKEEMIDYLRKFFSDGEYNVIDFDELKKIDVINFNKLNKIKVINFDGLNENYKNLEKLFKSKLEETYKTMQETYNREKLDELKKQALYIESLIRYAPFIRIESINKNNNDKVIFTGGYKKEEDIKTFLPKNTTMIVGHTVIFDMEKNVEQYSIAQLDRAAQNYFYDIFKKSSKYKNKYGIPNIGTIAESGNVIVYPLPLSSITVRDEIPEYYVSITNNEETFTVSVNANREIEVSKINEENIDEKILSRYKEKIPLKDRKNIIKNLLLCYQYDNANYLEENIDKINETKKTIIEVLEKELNTLSSEGNTTGYQEIFGEEPKSELSTKENRQIDKKSSVNNQEKRIRKIPVSSHYNELITENEGQEKKKKQKY